MKYCLSARQAQSVLSKADEIKVDWQDKNVLLDFIKNYSDKNIVLNIPKEVEQNEIDWNLITTYAESFKEFYICLEELREEYIEVCKQFNINFYWRYPITTFFELNSLKQLGVAQMLIGMPLCFDLEKVKSLTKDIKLRMVVNYAYDEYIPRLNGIKGQYVRPEDIPTYAQYISTFEFRTYGEDWITKEAALFHVYKDNQMWPGNLNLLITNLNKNVDNRAFPTNFGEIRSNCGQRCERNGTCHFCESTFLFVEQLKKEHNRRKKKEN